MTPEARPVGPTHEQPETPRVLRCGESAALVELSDLAEVLALQDVLRRLRDRPPLDAVREIVPAARTILLAYDPDRTTLDALARMVRSLTADLSRDPRPAPSPDIAPVEVPVRYDGPDLADVAAETALSVEDVVRLHCETPYRVGFCGFAPGFAYLVGLDPALHVPRRPSPRTRVPAGSVAIADEYTAVYPHGSPGGWRLIGRTLLRVWDPGRTPPALLAPGTPVRFVAVDPPIRR